MGYGRKRVKEENMIRKEWVEGLGKGKKEEKGMGKGRD